MKCKACIFDLDGVIVDTARFHFLAWKRLADDLNINFTEENNELLKGVSRTDSLDIILKLGNVELSQEKKDEFCTLKNEWFLDFVNNMTREDILEGVEAFLNLLKKNKILIALGSSSKNAQTILRKIDLLHFFDVVIDGTKIKKAKPDPEVFTKGADELGVPYSACVVFEDAEAGIEAAHNAQMKAIGVGTSPTLNKADILIENMNQIDLHTINTMFNT